MHRLILGKLLWDGGGGHGPRASAALGHVILRAVRSKKKSYSPRRPRSDTFLWAGGQSEGHACRPRKWRDSAAAHRRESALQSNITILSPPRATLSNSWVPTPPVPLGIVTKLPQRATNGECQSGRPRPFGYPNGAHRHHPIQRGGQEPGL